MRIWRHFVDFADRSLASHRFEKCNLLSLQAGVFRFRSDSVGTGSRGKYQWHWNSSLPRHGRTVFVMLMKIIGGWCRGTELNRRRQPFQGWTQPELYY